MSAVRRTVAALGAAAGAGRRRAVPSTGPAGSATETIHRQSRPERVSVRSTVMYPVHEQLARQTWHEASTEARRVRLVRALRAERRARRAERSAAQAGEVARRATERVVLA